MIVLHHRTAFGIGIIAVSVGAALHLPMYARARDTHYMMAGMPMDGQLKTGMALVLAGMALVAYGIVPRRGEADVDAVAQVRVRVLDDAPLRRNHVVLLVVMAAAVTIDVMRPVTLAFVMPGMAEEYGPRSPFSPGGRVPVGWLPLCALIGMVLGSLAWGRLGDRVGRRSSILLAGVIFIGTAICGTVPAFSWNLLMSFLMGVAVGGMLPTVFALMAETVPARHRGWLMALIGGGVAAAYLLTDFLAAMLQPHFGWRILWLTGLPAGALLVLLNQWIPESPRFLFATGRVIEAAEVMKRFGAVVMYGSKVTEPRAKGRFGQLLRHPVTGLTSGITLFGIGWTLVDNDIPLGAVPIALAAVAVARFGIDTRRRRLKEITAAKIRTAEIN